MLGAYLCVCQDLWRYYLIRPKSLPWIDEGCEYFGGLLALACGETLAHAHASLYTGASYILAIVDGRGLFNPNTILGAAVGERKVGGIRRWHTPESTGMEQGSEEGLLRR